METKRDNDAYSLRILNEYFQVCVAQSHTMHTHTHTMSPTIQPASTKRQHCNRRRIKCIQSFENKFNFRRRRQLPLPGYARENDIKDICTFVLPNHLIFLSIHRTTDNSMEFSIGLRKTKDRFESLKSATQIAMGKRPRPACGKWCCNYAYIDRLSRPRFHTLHQVLMSSPSKFALCTRQPKIDVYSSTHNERAGSEKKLWTNWCWNTHHPFPAYRKYRNIKFHVDIHGNARRKSK